MRKIKTTTANRFLDLAGEVDYIMSDSGAANDTSGDVEMDSPYNVNLQIAGIFIIMATSFCGMMLAFIMDHIDKRAMNKKQSGARTTMHLIIQLLRGTGVGVIISTALIHLIGEAYEPFEDSGFSEIYEQWPMVFAMAGMMLMAVLEYIHHHFDRKSCPVLEIESNPSVPELQGAPSPDSVKGQDGKAYEKEGVEESKGWGRKQWNAILVEGSILIHSVLIGFDLGLQNESGWIPLICAISFHQFFEGFAIGQVVLEAKFGMLKRSLMILFYSITTSVGIAIGIGTYLGQNYDGQSNGANITIGVLDSLCGGFLLYMGIAIFWVEWFVNNKNIKLSATCLGFLGITFGMAIMAVIGIWA